MWGAQHQTMADDKTQFHKVLIHNRSVFTTITTSAAMAGEWIVAMKKKCSTPDFRLMVGVDIDVVGENPRVATIQLSLRQETGIEVVAIDMCNFEGREYSLTELAAVVVPRLGFVRTVAARDWSAPVPSYEDVEYACIGAYVSNEIGDIVVAPTRN